MTCPIIIDGHDERTCEGTYKILQNNRSGHFVSNKGQRACLQPVIPFGGGGYQAAA